MITSASNETNAAEIDAIVVMNPNYHAEIARMADLVGLRARLLPC